MKKYLVELAVNHSYQAYESGQLPEGFVLPKGYSEFEVEAETIESAVDKAMYRLSVVAKNPDEYKVKLFEDEALIRFQNCEDGLELWFEVIERF